VAAVKAGDTLAIEAVRHAAHHLGWACHVLALVENPRTIVVTGPLAELGDWFRQELEASLVRHATHSHIQLPQIAVTTLGESVGALGAASLAIEAWKP
jgi:predicted NBD/HSP70 family sugar kinase